MDPETAEIIISQCYQQPCCSEKAEAVMSRPPLASPGDSAESDGCSALLCSAPERGTANRVGPRPGHTLALLALSELQGPRQCQPPA